LNVNKTEVVMDRHDIGGQEKCTEFGFLENFAPSNILKKVGCDANLEIGVYNEEWG